MNTSITGNHVIQLRFLFILILIFLLLTACTGEVNGVPEERPSSLSNITNGRKLIANYGCGSCHSIPGVPGADAMAGPPLEYFYQRTFIAGRLPNTRDNLIHWIHDPQGIEPGTAMPDLGVSESEAGDIADYLYHKITINDFISQ